MFKGYKINTSEDLDSTMVVYKLTFPNGKIYVGQTIRTLKHRINGHLQCSKRGLKTPLYNAISKYKEFSVEIIKICSSIEELNDIEKESIITLNSIVDNRKGYNSDYGGNNKLPSENMLQKCREKHSGKVLTQEHKDKISKSLLGIVRAPMKEKQKEQIRAARIGKKHSEETKAKMKASRARFLRTLQEPF